MNTLILYATKYGAAREIAGRLAKLIPDAEARDLKRDEIPSLAHYDCVVIGSSVYAGMIRKEAKVFMQKNLEGLSSKKLGLFISGMSAEGEKAYFESNFPKEILQTARAKSFLGGIFDPGKAGPFSNFIMKIVTKKSEYTDNISDEAIKAFAEALKN